MLSYIAPTLPTWRLLHSNRSLSLPLPQFLFYLNFFYFFLNLLTFSIISIPITLCGRRSGEGLYVSMNELLATNEASPIQVLTVCRLTFYSAFFSVPPLSKLKHTRSFALDCSP